MPFTATVLTMFPAAFPGPLGVSMIGTAWKEQDLWRLETLDIRAFSKDKRGFLDDTPAGGGAGAVLKADVIASALDSVERDGRPLLYMSARGRPLTQARVREWSKAPGIVVLCGRFEGVDQRVLDARGFEDGLLEHPQYTRPRTFEGLDIPEVLLSGDHKKIDQWRKLMREETTRERRPDLWEAHLANQQAKGDPKTGKPKEP